MRARLYAQPILSSIRKYHISRYSSGDNKIVRSPLSPLCHRRVSARVFRKTFEIPNCNANLDCRIQYLHIQLIIYCRSQIRERDFLNTHTLISIDLYARFKGVDIELFHRININYLCWQFIVRHFGLLWPCIFIL